MQTHLTILDKQMLLYSMVMSPRTSKEILLSIVSTVSTGSFCSSKPPIKITCAQHFGESHGVRNVCFKNCLSSHFKRASPARVFLAACACSQSSRYTSCKQIALAVERHLRQAEVCVHARLLTSVKEQGGGGGGGGGGGRFIQGGGRGGRGRHLFETPYDNKRKRTLRTPH